MRDSIVLLSESFKITHIISKNLLLSGCLSLDSPRIAPRSNAIYYVHYNLEMSNNTEKSKFSGEIK